MSYTALKYVHLAAVAVSFTLFFLRGVWMVLDSPLLRRRRVRVVPHGIDTLLLAAGVALAFMLHASLGENPWLVAKIAALFAYIGLGMLALRPGRTKRVRIAAWLSALAVFGYIVAVALSHSPSPWARG